MSSKLDDIKRYTTVYESKQGDRYFIRKGDLAWLIEQAEKAERLEALLKEVKGLIK